MVIMTHYNAKGDWRRINVTFATVSDIRIGGGAENVLYEFVKRAPSSKFDITVFQTSKIDKIRMDPGKFEEIRERATLVSVPAYEQYIHKLANSPASILLGGPFLTPLLYHLLRLTKYKEAIRKVRESDIIYLFDNGMLPFFAQSKSLIIGTNHAEFKDRSLMNRIDIKLIGNRLKHRRIDGFHLYPANADLATQLNKKMYIVLPNGIDTRKFVSESPVTDDVTKFLFVSRLEPCKGVLRLLEAWSAFRKTKQAELHIVGDGTARKSVEELATDNVIYHGILVEKDLISLYQSSDVFVFPTECDAFGIVVLEALATGMNAIVSENLKGVFDWFESKGVLEYTDNFSNSIRDKIKSYIDSKFKKQPSSQVNQYIQSNFSWDVIASKLYTEFERIVNRK